MNNVKQYRKKPVVIEAFLWDGQSTDELDDFLDGQSHDYGSWNRNGRTEYEVQINTLEGVMTADVGDYIIKGIKGEFYPCKPDIFEATYGAVLTPLTQQDKRAS